MKHSAKENPRDETKSAHWGLEARDALGGGPARSPDAQSLSPTASNGISNQQ